MTKDEISVLQGIAEKLLILCANADIENGKINDKVVNFRSKIKVVFDNKITQESGFTKKEIKEMPFLKDMHYRFTCGVHQYRYRRNGYNVQFSSKNKVVAQEKARDFISKLNKIERKTSETMGRTLDFVAYAWLDLKKAHTIKQTYKVYLGVYRNHIQPVFGNKPVKSILPMHLQPFFNDLFSRQERTCEDAKNILNGIFKYAVANRLCESNPMAGVIVERHFRKTGVALNDEQLGRFKEVMRQIGKYGLAALIMLYSGARGAELSSIRFDWEKGVMDIKNAKLKKSQKRNPLNLIRTVPIFPALYGLRSQIEESDAWRISGDMLAKRFCLYWRESTVKDLRHTFTTKARESGVENELVNIWTGHAPGRNQTANTYTHFSMDYQIEQARKIKPY